MPLTLCFFFYFLLPSSLCFVVLVLDLSCSFLSFSVLIVSFSFSVSQPSGFLSFGAVPSSSSAAASAPDAEAAALLKEQKLQSDLARGDGGLGIGDDHDDGGDGGAGIAR